MAKFKVPQKQGEIVLARNGEEPTVYPVTNGMVTITEPEHESVFAQLVEGAERIDGSEPASPAPGPESGKEK